MKNRRRLLMGQRSILNLVIVILFSVACQSSSSNASVSTPDGTKAKLASSAMRLPATNSGTSSAGPSKETHTAEPRIQITEVPSKGAGPNALETIAGRVSGVKGTECKVVVFAHTDTWYVQPYINSSDTSISDDGTWRTDTHLGNRYAALLVKSSYTPPTTTGRLPPVGREVLAVAMADAKP